MNTRRRNKRYSSDNTTLAVSARSGATRQLVGKSLSGMFNAWVVSHAQALIQSLGRIAYAPFSSLMTIAVIGIALALPAGLHVIIKNIQGVSAGWQDAAQISLFLKKNQTDTDIQRLVDDLTAWPEVDSVIHITPQQALDEFRQLSGFDRAGVFAVGDVFEENPLPTVLVVHPAPEKSAPAIIGPLLEQFQRLPGVDMAQLDLEWVQRLYALMEIGKRGVLVLALLLFLAVLLIVGNTIRLAIQNRHDEIEVQKLIGATDAFIRRPFLYSGFWHGLFGAVIAWLLVNVSMWALNGPVRRLSLLYDSHFELGALGANVTIMLILLGALLGLMGAWLAVGRHLRDIEPT